MNKALRNVTALFLAMLLCLCPLSVQAAGVTGDTVLASYRTLIDAYNNFADLHESYLVMLGSRPALTTMPSMPKYVHHLPHL